MVTIFLTSENIKYIDDLCVAIGQFDGLHIAHKELIKTAITNALENNLKSGVITFDPHPDFILGKQKDLTYITPIEEKIKKLESLNIDYLIIIPFNLEVASLHAKDFVEKYLLKIGVKMSVVGFDFRYGQFGKGTSKTLTADSDDKIKTIIVDEIKYNNEKIGSTMVRKLLKEGKIEEVTKLLGEFYTVESSVIHGRHVGSKIGIPTANLKISSLFVPVKKGVYGVRIKYHNKYYLGVCNIGHNPTFNYTNNLSLEVHIIDFNEDIYGEKLKVEFLLFLRDETVFPSIEDFKKQIAIDINRVKNFKI